MRRWNGWGEESFHLTLPEAGAGFLQERIGEGHRLADADLASVCETVPVSRLPGHPLVAIDAETRVRHARGQSLPDWLALRSGDIQCFPDGVAEPETTEEVAQLLQWAHDHEITLIPYGGGTSVAGHINPLQQERPVLTLSLARMNRLLDLDPESQIATFGAGTPGPLVEAQLQAEGYTLGHFPQSFELSTVGGWVASRSSGQQSLRYGRIEQLFAGGRMETLRGPWVIPTFPASAAGPDVREMVLGSEGRLGVITQVKVRITRLPEKESFHVLFFPDWNRAREATRAMVQQRVNLSMLRLSNPVETETQLALAGHPRMIAGLERFLAWRGCKDSKCMMTLGVTGSVRQCDLGLSEMKRISRRFGGVYTGTYLGKKWAEKRFTMPYLREALWQAGYAVDTLETATDWDNVAPLMAQVEESLRQGLSGESQPVHVFSHLSHVYSQGCSIYTTYVFPCGKDYQATLERWKTLKTRASSLIVSNRGTISHQHGVGKDHAPWLPQEKGPMSMAAIESLCREFDPRGLLNPGTLLMENGHDESGHTPARATGARESSS